MTDDQHLQSAMKENEDANATNQNYVEEDVLMQIAVLESNDPHGSSGQQFHQLTEAELNSKRPAVDPRAAPARTNYTTTPLDSGTNNDDDDDTTNITTTATTDGKIVSLEGSGN